MWKSTASPLEILQKKLSKTNRRANQLKIEGQSIGNQSENEDFLHSEIEKWIKRHSLPVKLNFSPLQFEGTTPRCMNNFGWHDSLGGDTIFFLCRHSIVKTSFFLSWWCLQILAFSSSHTIISLSWKLSPERNLENKKW